MKQFIENKIETLKEEIEVLKEEIEVFVAKSTNTKRIQRLKNKVDSKIEEIEFYSNIFNGGLFVVDNGLVIKNGKVVNPFKLGQKDPNYICTDESYVGEWRINGSHSEGIDIKVNGDFVIKIHYHDGFGGYHVLSWTVYNAAQDQIIGEFADEELVAKYLAS